MMMMMMVVVMRIRIVLWRIELSHYYYSEITAKI
jgi:hypothetical protein